MRRRRAAAPSFGLSLLDLLSCAFGGVIVLAVVMSALLGSSRVIEERSFLVLDITVSAPEETAASERLAAIDDLMLGLELKGPDWRAIWRGDQAVLPIRDSGVRATAISGGTDGATGRRHLTVVVRGLVPGTYRASVAALGPESPSWQAYREQVKDRPLYTEIEVRHPGDEGLVIALKPTVTLDGLLWQGDLTIQLDG